MKIIIRRDKLQYKWLSYHYIHIFSKREGGTLQYVYMSDKSYTSEKFFYRSCN